MEAECYPPDVLKFIRELKRRGVLDDDLTDRTFVNYLYSQKYDEDYVESMDEDR